MFQTLSASARWVSEVRVRGVAELLGQDAVVPLHLAVVGEVLGPVAGTVVSDDPLDVDDAVRGEPSAGAVHETDCSDGLLIGQGLGIGQSGEPIDGVCK
jgi:hypothetical protein